MMMLSDIPPAKQVMMGHEVQQQLIFHHLLR